MSRRPKELLQRYHAWVEGDHRERWRMRLLQSLWREENGLAAGEDQGEKRGARLTKADAFENYLTRKIRAAVKKRGFKYRDNLLSSQTLCFNLFGELTCDPKLATCVLADMSKGRVARVSAIRFEFSPGRQDRRYTGDGSAFDVYVKYKTKSGGEGFVGIEVKYHEDLSSGKEREHYQKHGERYNEIAEEMFRGAELCRLQGTRFQQIWRDHLLMGAHKKADNFEDAFFVLLYPKANCYYSQAVEDYRKCLCDASSFQSWTLEDMVQRLMAHSCAKWIQSFHHRYLDFSRVEELLDGPEGNDR